MGKLFWITTIILCFVVFPVLAIIVLGILLAMIMAGGA
jgi:nitrate reductase NapE component